MYTLTQQDKYLDVCIHHSFRSDVSPVCHLLWQWELRIGADAENWSLGMIANRASPLQLTVIDLANDSINYRYRDKDRVE